jgi:hypothetical protein
MKQRVKVRVKLPKVRNQQLNAVLRRCKSGRMKDKRKDQDERIERQLELSQ